LSRFVQFIVLFLVADDDAAQMLPVLELLLKNCTSSKKLPRRWLMDCKMRNKNKDNNQHTPLTRIDSTQRLS